MTISPSHTLQPITLFGLLFLDSVIHLGGFNSCLNIIDCPIFLDCGRLPTGHIYATKCPEKGYCYRWDGITIFPIPWDTGSTSQFISSPKLMPLSKHKHTNQNK